MRDDDYLVLLSDVVLFYSSHVMYLMHYLLHLPLLKNEAMVFFERVYQVLTVG